MPTPNVYRTETLLAAGATPRQIARWVAAGRLRRVGSYWLVTPEASAPVVRALQRGLRLTCLDAAREHGLWTPPDPELHVFRRRGGSTRPHLDRVRLHRPEPRAWPDDQPIASLELTLRHAVGCLDSVGTAILVESAWERGLLGAAEVSSFLATLPRRHRDALARVRGDAGSGTETRVRWWLESLRVGVRAQVQIRGVGRVDLLVGRAWVIECDSAAHHTGVASYAEDRRRDLELRRRGYTVTRLTWEQVFTQWDQTRAALLTLLHRGEHHRPVDSSSSGP